MWMHLEIDCALFPAATEKQQIQDLQVKIRFHWQLPVQLWWEVQRHRPDDRWRDLPAAAWCRYSLKRGRLICNIRIFLSFKKNDDEMLMIWWLVWLFFVRRNWQAVGPTHCTPLYSRSTLRLWGENSLGWWKWVWPLWGKVLHNSWELIKKPSSVKKKKQNEKGQFSNKTSCRTCSRPTGRQWGSNPHLQTPILAGESSSVPWR